MKSNVNQSRRNMLKFGGAALAFVPVAAFAAKNEAVRKAMSYKDTPEGDKKCSNCIQFVPGKPRPIWAAARSSPVTRKSRRMVTARSG